MRHRKILLSLLTLALFLLLAGVAQASSFLDDADAIDRVAKSILMLEVYNDKDELVATGSGFVAFDNYTLVTNYHVMEDASTIIANSDTGIRYMVTKVIVADQSKDIAILEFFSPTDLVPLTLDSISKPRRIDRIVAIGSPKGITNSASTGNISAVYEENGVEYIQFTAPISPGSSGGALFNANGDVIGITSATYIDSQNMNLAVNIGEVIELHTKTIDIPRVEIADFESQTKETPIPTPTPTPVPLPANIPIVQNIHVRAVMNFSVCLSWDKVPYVVEYYIYRSLYPDKGFALISEANYSPHYDNNVIAGVVYYYKISCIENVESLSELSAYKVAIPSSR